MTRAACLSAGVKAMLDLNALLGHWGYLAIFLVVFLGNVGLPVPEATILALAGYLVWEGKLRLPLVLVVGVGSAAAGDNLGYWIGRRYGQETLARYGHWIGVTSARLETMRRFVGRYGPLAVFAARFLAGFRCLAGPVAGSAGLPAFPFVAANLLGAVIYVPLAVGAGYAAGYGLGAYVERLGRFVGEVEYLILIVAISSALGVLGWRIVRARRARQTP